MIRQRQPLVILGMLTAMSSAASYGLLVTMVRHVVTTQAHPIVMIAFSSLFGAIMTTVIFHRHVLQDSRAPRKAFLLAGVSGLFSLGATGSLYTALQFTEVVVVAPLMGTYPLVTVVMAHLTLKRIERLTLPTLLGVVLVVLGVALISIGAVTK